MKQYETYNHVKTLLKYHLIFSTKYRRKCLVGIEKELEESFRYIESVSNFRIEKLGIDKDHVHFLMRSCPSMPVSSIVRRLKQISTRQMWQKQKEHLSNFYWGNKKGKLWTNGYFCCTVGDVSLKTVEKYIENQG